MKKSPPISKSAGSKIPPTPFLKSEDIWESLKNLGYLGDKDSSQLWGDCPILSSLIDKRFITPQASVTLFKLFSKVLKITKNVDGVSRTSKTTPLMNAVEVNDLRLVRLLIDKGANPNAQSIHGATVLMHALGLTSLSAAYHAPQKELIVYLLNQGANIHAVNKEGFNVIELLTESLSNKNKTSVESSVNNRRFEEILNLLIIHNHDLLDKSIPQSEIPNHLKLRL